MSSYRSSSQVSVYNYPEHLNPFYEDEQHKRLRFWKVKKNNSSNSNKNDDGSGSMRRGSFNFGSLRDLFRTGSLRRKKQSSTLGVNMTSESPPILRRDFIDYNKEDEDKYAAHDPHFRHTIDQRAFQRNAPYRSSLQNMNSSPNDLSFARNNRYRSTIQNGSMQHISTLRTPTLKGRYLTDSRNRMTPGSSMNSISTNPFDDDYDDDNENVENVNGTITVNSVGQTGSSKKHERRKKRRAPPPPNQIITKSTSEDENVQIRINEDVDGSSNSKNGLDELSRLTAEFESFVKNSANDIYDEPRLIINEDEVITRHHNEKSELLIDEKKEAVKPKISVTVEQSVTKNEIIEKITDNRVAVSRDYESPDKTIAIIQEDLKIREIELKIKEDELRIKEALEEVNNNNNCNKNNEKVLKIEKVLDENSEDENNKESSPDVQTLEVQQTITEIRRFPEIQRITPTPSSREETPDFIPLPVREKFDILRIEENENDLKKPEDIKQEKSLSNIQIQHIEDKQNEIQAKPMLQTKVLKSNFIQEPRGFRDHTPIPMARTEIESKLSSQGFQKIEKPLKYDDFEKCIVRHQYSMDDDCPEGEDTNVILRDAPKAPERRRSVKEIIESINRQQQKLKVNQPPSPQLPRQNYNYNEQKYSYHEKPALPPKDNVLLKLQRQAENEKKINDLLDDLQDFSKENVDAKRTHQFPLTESDKNNNNNSTFPNDRPTRDDINPIPKPRRVI